MATGFPRDLRIKYANCANFDPAVDNININVKDIILIIVHDSLRRIPCE